MEKLVKIKNKSIIKQVSKLGRNMCNIITVTFLNN